MRQILGSLAAAAVLLGVAPGISAATPGPVNEPALIAAAKAEGLVQIYGAGQSRALDAIAKKFEATYGIKVSWIQMQGYAIPPRLVIEKRGGASVADVITGESGLETEQIKRAGLFAQYRPPETRDLLAGTFDPDGYWVASQLYTEAICYNPERAKAAGIKPPRTWDDLASKEWRGQFSLFNGSWEWYAAMKRFYGTDHANALMRAYAANQPRITGSHQLGITLTSSGDVSGAANVYAYGCLLAKDKGAPVEVVNPNPTVIEVGTVGILKDAPHPNAARLLERWMITREIEQWAITELGENVPRKDVKNDPRVMNPKVHYLISDTRDLDALNADIKEFKDIFNIPV